MKKQLEQQHEALPDLFFWIKEYISFKVVGIKAKEGFDRLKQFQRVLNCTNMDEFIGVQLDIRKNGQPTLISYTNPLINLYRFVEKEKSFFSIKDFDTNMRDKIFIQNEKGYTEKSQMAYLVQINGLFKYIENNSLDGDEPYSFNLGKTRGGRKTKMPIQKDDEDITFLEADEMRRFISGMETFPFKGENPSKPKLMMLIALYGGLRAEELISLKRSKVELVEVDNPILKGMFLRLYVDGKGSKERVVYIKENLIKKEYSNYIADSLNCDSGLLFCTYGNERYTSSAVYQQTERLLYHAGIDKGVNGIHLLRRSYASYLAINDVDFAIISELLGHESEDVTELYVKLSRKGTRKIVKQWKDF